MDANSLFFHMKGNSFDFQLIHGPTDIELSYALFRSPLDLDKFVTFFISEKEIKNTRILIEEDRILESKFNHQIEFVVIGIEHEIGGPNKNLPPLCYHIWGHVIAIGDKILDTDDFIWADIFYIERDDSGRFKSQLKSHFDFVN